MVVYQRVYDIWSGILMGTMIINTCNLVYKVSTQTPWNSNSRQEMMTDKGTLEWPILQTKQEYRDKGKRTPFPKKELCTWKPEGIDEQWLGSFFFDGTKHMLSGSQACPSCSDPALPVLRKVKNWTMESISWHEMMWASMFPLEKWTCGLLHHSQFLSPSWVCPKIWYV